MTRLAPWDASTLFGLKLSLNSALVFVELWQRWQTQPSLTPHASQVKTGSQWKAAWPVDDIQFRHIYTSRSKDAFIILFTFANLHLKSHYAFADCVTQFCFHKGILSLKAQQKQACKRSQIFKKATLGEGPDKCIYDPHILKSSASPS